MIRVFGQTDKNFISNGDAVLHPLKAKVHKEDNGDFYLDLVCDLEHSDYLVHGNIVVANTPQGDQAFRIKNPTKTNNKISVKAWHVSYDAENYLIADSYVVNKDCNGALRWLNNASEPQSPFTVGSNVSTTGSYRCVRTSLYDAFKTVLENWGGHLVRDNYDLKILSSIGSDNGITVEYRKNLKEITAEENWNDVVTKLLPVGKDGILLNALDSSVSIYMESSVQYAIPYCKTVSFQQDINQEDYSSETEYKQALIADLRTQASAYLRQNSVPKVNYTLKASLNRTVDLGDTIEVKDKRLGLNLLTKVISYEYDCILKRYTEVEFGNFKKKLSNLINNVTSSATSSAVQSASQMVDASLESVQTSINQIESSITVLDGKLVLTNATELEAGYSTDYSTFNINVLNSNGDAISLNDMKSGRNPALTYLPDNDWSQAQSIGKLAFLSDIPTLPDVLNRSSFGDTWSGIHAGSSVGTYVTLKTFTLPANSRWLVLASNGNGQGGAVDCNLGISVTSGTASLVLEAGSRSRDTGGNIALGWCYIRTTTACTVSIRTYTYNTSVTNFNGKYVAIPVL